MAPWGDSAACAKGDVQLKPRGVWISLYPGGMTWGGGSFNTISCYILTQNLRKIGA